MRLSHVNETASLLAFFLWSCFANSVYCQSPPPRVLDLTARGVAERKSMGVPGNRLGSIDAPSALPTEPRLRVSVKSAELEGASVRVVLKLENHSKVALEIPSCTDGMKAHRPGNRNRKTVQYSVEFLDSQMKVLSTQVADVTFGSSSLPECVVPLAPGETLLVVFRAALPGKGWVPSTNGAQFIRASVMESELEDTKYSIAKISSPIQSDVIALK